MIFPGSEIISSEVSFVDSLEQPTIIKKIVALINIFFIMNMLPLINYFVDKESLDFLYISFSGYFLRNLKE